MKQLTVKRLLPNTKRTSQIIEFDPDAKVVMASSVGTQGHLKEALRAGAADFLQKPISDEDTRAILENAAKGVL